MKIIDIANKIDKTQKNEDWIDLKELGDELGLDIWNADIPEQDRLKCYWIARWYCTDSYVGYRMYFFDNEPVAISSQQGRKCDENFDWFSEEKAFKVKDYLLTFEKEKEMPISIIDINEEMGAEGIKISFNSQILDKDRVFYNGEKVEIKKLIREDKWGLDEKLIITLSNGEDKEVDINDLLFKFRINE